MDFKCLHFMVDGCTHKILMVIWALIDVLWLSLIFDGYNYTHTTSVIETEHHGPEPKF